MLTPKTLFVIGFCAIVFSILAADLTSFNRLNKDKWECTSERKYHEVAADGSAHPITVCYQYTRTE